jgi:O-Antigen ligase
MDNKYFSLKLPLLCLLFFFLPAANSYPGKAYYFLTSMHGSISLPFIILLLIPANVISVLLLMIRLANGENFFSNLTRFSLTLLITIGVFFLAGTFSIIANFEIPGAVTAYMSTIMSVWLIALAFVNLRLGRGQNRLIYIAFAIGCLFPLILGLKAYYNSWGIPNLPTVVMSHFDLIKMDQYFTQTFGNADNTSVIMGMAGIIFFCLLLNNRFYKSDLILFGIVFAFLVINLLILEVRTTIVCFIFLSLVISYVRSRRFFLGYILMLGGLFLIIYVLSPTGLYLFLNRINMAMTWSDNSAAERLEAMRIGWKVFKDNFILGVGPGASSYFIIYSTAHQFNIQQAVELGILGCIASIVICFLAIWQFFRLSFLYYIGKVEFEKLTFASAPAFYFLYSTFSNPPLALGVVNTWICIAVIMLFLSDCEFIIE